MSFNDDLMTGKSFECEIQKLIPDCRLATEKEQKMGIDLVAGDVSLECKWDLKAAKTGNIFLEIVTGRKMGCVLTCQADYMVWRIGDEPDYLLFKPSDLVRIWADNLDRKRIDCYRSCFNPNRYSSVGYLVPLEQLLQFRVSSEQLVDKITNINQPKEKTNEKQTVSQLSTTKRRKSVLSKESV